MRFAKTWGWAGFAAVSLACAGTGPEGAGGQGSPGGDGPDDPPQTLVFFTGHTNVTGFAAGRLGHEITVIVDSETFLIQYLQQQRWDLVTLDAPKDTITRKAEVADLLRDHVVAGGRLLVNYSRIDLWPELQELMDVRIVRPLARSLDVFRTEPRHLTWITFSRINVSFEPWPDMGHEIDSGMSSYVISLYSNETGATVLSTGHRMIFNGFNWDSYSSGGAISLAESQLWYIMKCQSDFNDDGQLDFFDFLDFQNAFLAQHPRANLHFDANFDFFDFLEFQRLFLMGCD